DRGAVSSAPPLRRLISSCRALVASRFVVGSSVHWPTWTGSTGRLARSAADRSAKYFASVGFWLCIAANTAISWYPCAAYAPKVGGWAADAPPAITRHPDSAVNDGSHRLVRPRIFIGPSM